MAAHPITTWQDGRLVDAQPVPARPRAFVGAVLLLLVLVDLALALTPEPRDVEVVDVAGARRELARAAAAPDASWLLIGDSVLAGDVMRGEVEDWRERRVIDAMREAAAPDAGVYFGQVALDALLPVDIERVVRELDAVDPAARVAVAIELNPRYFSRHYAGEAACTRPFLCELGPEFAAPWPWLAALARDAIADYLPVYRHRWRLGLEAWRAELPSPIEPQETAAPDGLAARARLLAHYQDLALGDDSAQVQALARTAARLRASGRRAVFFTTPLEDGFVAEAMSPAEYGDYAARMSRLVDGGSVQLVHLDHPLFASPLFLDHCHLGPEGNRRLAVNLLAELGVGLADVPEPAELAHDEGPDTTLVARVGFGSSDGAAWQAQLRDPRGLAVAPGGRRVVVADTGNHCLRELVGDLQTVRRLAGACGQAGSADGPADKARLERPTDPVLVGDAVYFVDQERRRVRVLADGEVKTLARTRGPRWKKIDQLAADHDRLLLRVDGGERLLAFDLHTRRSSDLVLTRAGRKIKAFAVAPDRRIFLADDQSRIYVGDLDRPMVLGPAPSGLELEFPNLGEAPVPQRRGLYFPLTYADARFADIVGMTWVDRYGGLLIQDDLPNERKGRRPAERIQLRMLDPATDLVYPWLKPLVHGGGQILRSRWSGSYLSYWHEGAMALDQDTATLFWLERHRSRLFHVADGILGAAKAGLVNDLEFHEVRDLFGVRSAAEALAKLRPDRFLARRLEPRPRRGPYLGVVFGSSMLAVSDLVGFYSFGVRLEDRLRRALGLRDGVRLDIVQRSYRGVPSEKVLQELRNFVDVGARPDVIFIELNGSRNRFFESGNGDARLREVLAEIDGIARRYDSLVVFFDDAALVSPGHDGLRPTPRNIERFKAMARAAGFVVLDLSDELLRVLLDRSPFGSPPYANHHASPWAIDAAADLLGDRVYPRLREHLRDRVPALLRPRVREDPTVAALADAFTRVAADWPTLLPPLPGESVQSDLSGDHLEVFVDLAGITVDPADAEALADVAAAALHAVIARDHAGTRARTVAVRLASFSRYDEYGAGVRDAAEVLYSRRFDLDGLVEFLRAVQARRG